MIDSEFQSLVTPLNGFRRWPFHAIGDSVLYHSLAGLAPPTAFLGAVTCLRCRQAVNMDLSHTTAWFATPAMRLYRLWCPFGEVQQDLLLSSFTIGQAYCLLEVLK